MSVKWTLQEATKLFGTDIGDGNVMADCDGTSFTLIRQASSAIFQYHIIRRGVHEGTLLFTHDLIRSAMLPLLRAESYWAKEVPEQGMLPEYIIGDIVLREVQEYVKPERFTWPTMCEEVIIPVRADWRYRG